MKFEVLNKAGELDKHVIAHANGKDGSSLTTLSELVIENQAENMGMLNDSSCSRIIREINRGGLETPIILRLYETAAVIASQCPLAEKSLKAHLKILPPNAPMTGLARELIANYIELDAS